MVWSLELGELGELGDGKDPILCPVKTPTVARAAPPCGQGRSTMEIPRKPLISLQSASQTGRLGTSETPEKPPYPRIRPSGGTHLFHPAGGRDPPLFSPAKNKCRIW